MNLDNSLTLDDVKTFCQGNEYLKDHYENMEFKQVSKTHNGIKIVITCNSWPSGNKLAFSDVRIWPKGSTIKALKGTQRTLATGENPDERRFVCKFFSNLSPEQSLDGVKNKVTQDYKDSSCNTEVQVYVKKFEGKDPEKNKGKNRKTAFTVLVVPKNKDEKIKDILVDVYKPDTQFEYNSIRCRNWGGTIPDELATYI